MKAVLRFTLVVAVLLGCMGCDKIINPRVVYLVEGTASSYNISYIDAQGTTQIDTVPYNWSVSFEGSKGDDLMITATASENNCWAKVYIYIDGKLLGSDYQYGDKPTATVTKKLKLVF